MTNETPPSAMDELNAEESTTPPPAPVEPAPESAPFQLPPAEEIPSLPRKAKKAAKKVQAGVLQKPKLTKAPAKKAAAKKAPAKKAAAKKGSAKKAAAKKGPAKKAAAKKGSAKKAAAKKGAAKKAGGAKKAAKARKSNTRRR